MTTVLDAYALVALLAGEPAAGEVERIIRTGDVAVTSVNYGECLDRLIRVAGFPEARVHSALETLLEGPVARIDVGFDLMRDAARLRSAHYDRQRSPLSLADCTCLAATGQDDSLATADRPLLFAARAEGIAAVALAPTSPS